MSDLYLLLVWTNIWDMEGVFKQQGKDMKTKQLAVVEEKSSHFSSCQCHMVSEIAVKWEANIGIKHSTEWD